MTMTVKDLKKIFDECNDDALILGIFANKGATFEHAQPSEDGKTVYLVSKWYFPVKRSIVETAHKNDPDYLDMLM